MVWMIEKASYNAWKSYALNTFPPTTILASHWCNDDGVMRNLNFQTCFSCLSVWELTPLLIQAFSFAFDKERNPIKAIEYFY